MNKTSKASALSSAAYTFYETNAVAEDIKAQLEETAMFLIGATRRSTEETFKLGEHLEHAAGLLPEGTLEKWAVERCGYTARHVRTQRAVFRNLDRYREILVELAVGPTVLGKLSAAKPEQIEQAIGFAAQNGKLRVQDVAAIVAGSKNEAEAGPQIDPHDIGGLEGLKAIIAIKVRDGIKSFIGHLEEIRAHVNEELPKKNIVKKTLSGKTHLVARLANEELKSLAQFVRPHPNAAYVISPTSIPVKTGWGAVSAMLYKMGSETTWPDKGELRTWLETEVVPLLEWASAKTKDPVWPKADKASISPSATSLVDTSLLASNQQRPQNDGVPVVAGSEGDTVEAEAVKRLEAMLAPFGAKVTMEPSAASKQILPEDSIPSLAEALAEPPKAFKRPAFLDRVKPDANKADDVTATAA